MDQSVRGVWSRWEWVGEKAGPALSRERDTSSSKMRRKLLSVATCGG